VGWTGKLEAKNGDDGPRLRRRHDRHKPVNPNRELADAVDDDAWPLRLQGCRDVVRM